MSKNLKEFLVECKDAYYAGNPIISDAEYDHLEEIYNEDLSVGTNRGRTRHWFRMYSLEKYYMGEEFPVWQTGVYMEDETDTPKLDGAAIALRYINGEFDSAVTRGNGEYGEDITHLFEKDNLYKLNIPKDINLSGTVQITGEIVAPKYINNARNYAAGAINLKDPTEFRAREITFVAYGLQPFMSETYTHDMDILVHLGFETVLHCTYLDDFPQDGRVVRLDNNAKYIDAGFTSKHPKGAFAVKERTEGIKTKILDVVWQTGKSGKVTPVAILEPIEIDGATVSRATLNNFGFIQALGVQIGDSVMVERAGGIIPRIIKKAE